MTVRPGRLNWSRAAGPLAAVSVCALLVSSPSLRDAVRSGLAGLSWTAVAVTIPLQIAGLILCGLALRLAASPEVRLQSCLLARWIRDAGGNLLLVAPGLGEAAALRLLTLSGARLGSAIEALALDTVAESAAQAPYIALGLSLSRAGRAYGLALLQRVKPDTYLSVGAPLALTVAGLGMCALAGGWLIRGARATVVLRQALSRHGPGFLRSFACHLGAWALGGLQIYAAAAAMRVPLPVGDALALEGLVYGLRGLCFFVPGGLGVQEAGVLFGGALFGLTPTAAASLAITLRVRDAVVGAPALATWAMLEFAEWRSEARRRPGREASSPAQAQGLASR